MLFILYVAFVKACRALGAIGTRRPRPFFAESVAHVVLQTCCLQAFVPWGVSARCESTAAADWQVDNIIDVL